MWYRFNDGRIQNLVTGVELRTRAQGNVWQVIVDSPATNPAITVLASGFTSETNANAALNAFLSDNNVNVMQPIPAASIQTSKE